jgi:hypothetical protein
MRNEQEPAPLVRSELSEKNTTHWKCCRQTMLPRSRQVGPLMDGLNGLENNLPQKDTPSVMPKIKSPACPSGYFAGGGTCEKIR